MTAHNAESVSPTDFGQHLECPLCDDSWDFVGDGPFRCPHCNSRLDDPHSASWGDVGGPAGWRAPQSDGTV